MNERHIARPSSDNIVQFPAHLSFVERDDPYGELGGGLASHRSVETLPAARELSFFDIDQRTPDKAWQLEVNRAYNLSLNGALQPKHLKQLKKKELQVVATAVDDLYKTLCHRAPALLVNGNYEHASFLKYNFESQEQANDYAGLLFALRDDLDEQLVVKQLIALHYDQYGRKTLPPGKLSEARGLQVITIDENDQVSLEYSKPVTPRLHSI